jgi:sulfonate transport system substrate-binding protein
MMRCERDHGIDRRRFLSLAAVAGAFELANAYSLRAADAPDAVVLDYAYYNPVSLLLKKKGWLEAELAKDGIGLRWVLSLGSNKALEFLRGGSIDFGSTAGSAAIVARAGGVPIKAIYVYSKPEWTALVTRKDSGIGRIQDLKDKSVAVTRGTDPHIFLLRALDTKGFTENDVNAVLLQHPDGYRALATRQVDAWAGLDPHMAKAQIETGAILFYRNQSFNTYGILNVREAFAKRYPDLVRRVLAVYERARTYAVDHPDELVAELVDVAGVSPEVAHIQLDERTDLSTSAIGSEHRATFTSTGEVLRRIGIIDASIDVRAILDGWLDASYLRSVG